MRFKNLCLITLLVFFLRACLRVRACETTGGTAPKSRWAPDAGDNAAQSPGGRGAGVGGLVLAASVANCTRSDIISGWGEGIGSRVQEPRALPSAPTQPPTSSYRAHPGFSPPPPRRVCVSTLA